MSDTTNPNKFGVHSFCVICGKMKHPIGRSAPPEMSLCDDDCGGYRQEPFVGSLWPGESEADFGYLVDATGTEIRPLSDKPQGEIIELLATKVMGWKLCSYEGDMDYTPNDWTPEKAQSNDGWYWDGMPNDEAWQWNPLTDPAASKQLREKLAEMGLSWELFGPVRHPLKPRLNGKFGCKIATWDGNFYDPKWEAYDDTEEMAVALCALKSVGAL